MRKGLLKNIFGDMFTSSAGAALGFPTIVEGVELMPTDKTAGIIKMVVGVGTLLLGLLSKAKADPQ